MDNTLLKVSSKVYSRGLKFSLLNERVLLGGLHRWRILLDMGGSEIDVFNVDLKMVERVKVCDIRMWEP